MQKAHLVSVMASGAAAQMNGGPAFLGAFGMGGGFEPPAMYAGRNLIARTISFFISFFKLRVKSSILEFKSMNYFKITGCKA